MTVPVLTFFNNKGGVGKTSLVYHLAWMFSERGHRVLACDLDPQANLTSMFLEEDRLESVYEEGDGSPSPSGTIFECVRPLMEVGDLRLPDPPEDHHRVAVDTRRFGARRLRGHAIRRVAKRPSINRHLPPFQDSDCVLHHHAGRCLSDGCLRHPRRCRPQPRRDQPISPDFD